MKNFLIILVACVVGGLAAPAENVAKSDAEIEFITVKNLTEYIHSSKLNFNILPLKRDSSNLIQIRYTLGNRISGKLLINHHSFETKKKKGHVIKLFLGDRILTINSDNQQWAQARDVELTLTYPRSGIGSVVSYVDILVDQVMFYTFII